jgi:uncharacterized protein (DUF2236 family)
MHPVIGAGVRDFSDYRTDPWGRLDRTLRSLQLQIFGGTKAVDEAARLRELHKSIKGMGFHGERYSALDQEAYAWVHLSNFDTLLSFNKWFGRTLSLHEQKRAYGEWKQIGRVLGIRDVRMPADLPAFKAYAHDMYANTLEANPTARELVGVLALEHIGAPPWRAFPEPLWRALRPAGRFVLRDITVGTLPSVLRQRLDLPWNAADRRRLQGISMLVRGATVAVPDRLMQYPMGYRAQQKARAHAAGRAA